METPETLLLIDRCLAGEEAALDDLVARYQRQVFRLAVSILNDPLEAQDAAQDALISALAHLSEFRREASLKTWLFTITINICRRRLRKIALRSRLQQILQGVFRFEQDSPASPEDQFLFQQGQANLWHAIQALPDYPRMAIILHYYHGLPVDEMQAILQVSRRTIYYWLDRGHQQIRRNLEQEDKP